MDTAEKVGIKPNGRHFWEGYKGLFTSGGGNGYSNGFEDRHPLYPNAAAHIAASTGGGTHEDDGGCLRDRGPLLRHLTVHTPYLMQVSRL